VPFYESGAEIIADARMRLSGLPHDQGILILEGGDDLRLFLEHAISGQSLIACGNKRKLLEAHALLEIGEDRRIIFVTDCDYDVPAGRLRPSDNLIVTGLTDVEADLLALGVLRRMVIELVPVALESDAQASNITQTVMERASALAEPVGRFRLLSAQNDLKLCFKKLRLGRYRHAHTANADITGIAQTLASRSPECPLTSKELLEAVAQVQENPQLCQGKDLLLGAISVLHQDYAVPTSRLKEAHSMLRLALTADAFETWSVVRRIDRWETQTARRVLRP